jgi:hypothetical protein
MGEDRNHYLSAQKVNSDKLEARRAALMQARERSTSEPD